MSAEPKEWEKEIVVSFTTEDEDFSVKAAGGIVKAQANIKDYLKSAVLMISYDGDLEYAEDLKEVGLFVEVYAYNSVGATLLYNDVYNPENIMTELNKTNLYNEEGKALYNEVEFVFVPLIDGYSEGDQLGSKGATGDNKDDRDQNVITIQVEGWNSRAEQGSGKFTKSQWIASTDKLVESAIKSTDGYAERIYVGTGKDRVAYRLVFNVKGDEVVATWEKDPAELIVWGEVKEEPKYDELDANKDGVVSCEEALGKGWVWNNETSACELKGSSNTGSYVPNTATK